MKRATLLIAGAVLVAAAALRRRVPSYGSWAEYVAADCEGEALPPDPYLVALRDELALREAARWRPR